MDRKVRFEQLNTWINQQGGAWLISIPGDVEVRLEVLPSSRVPQRLGELGYQLHFEGEGERVLAVAVEERFTRNAHGEMEPLTAGSTARVVHRVVHAGIVRIERFSFALQRGLQLAPSPVHHDDEIEFRDDADRLPDASLAIFGDEQRHGRSARSLPSCCAAEFRSSGPSINLARPPYLRLPMAAITPGTARAANIAWPFSVG